jgi:hypothetical protein
MGRTKGILVSVRKIRFYYPTFQSKKRHKLVCILYVH